MTFDEMRTMRASSETQADLAKTIFFFYRGCRFPYSRVSQSWLSLHKSEIGLSSSRVAHEDRYLYQRNSHTLLKFDHTLQLYPWAVAMMTTPPSFLILLLLVLAMTLLNGSSAGGGITSTTTTLVLDEKHPYSFLNMTSEGLISKDQARTSSSSSAAGTVDFSSGITTTTLVLEKDTSIMNMTFDEMRDMDQARHRRMLRRRTSSSSATGTVDFPVEGDFDPYRRGQAVSSLLKKVLEYYLKIAKHYLLWV